MWKEENNKLKLQKVELQKVNLHLEAEILRRMEALTQSNKRIADYIDVSKVGIAPILDDLISQIRIWPADKGSRSYIQLLKSSGVQLGNAFKKILVNH